MYNGVSLAICTYNRCNILKYNLDLNLKYILELGFFVTIYDSSTNDDTKNLISDYNKVFGNAIKYVKLASEVRVDDKVLNSIIDSDNEYVWPISDCIFFKKEDIKNLVLPFLDKKFDFVCLYNRTIVDNENKVYNNALEFVEECFWNATWLGGIIFKKEIFAPLNNKAIYNRFEEKYNKNDGFSYLGIFYDLIANKRIQSVFLKVDFLPVNLPKIQGWMKRYLEVWCYNLCYLVDNIDEYYDGIKEKIIKDTWRILKLDKFNLNYKARLMNGLNNVTYSYYDKLGYLNRVTDDKSIIELCAKAPIVVLKLLNFFINNRDRIRNKLNGIFLKE